MTWDKTLALAVACLPLAAFFVALVAELHAGGLMVVLRTIPLIIGMNAFVMFWAANWSETTSHVMTMVSVAVAGSPAFIPYSRRSSSVWVACGGVILVLLWAGNQRRT